MFNEKLIELRKQNNQTQDSLAKQLYVSRSLIAKWEQGRSYPTLENLEKISKLYNLEIDDLITKNELKKIYGIVSKKDKSKKKIILSLSLLLSLFLVTTLTLPFCFVKTVLQEQKICKKFNMRYGYNNIILDNGSTIEINDETKLFINGEKINFHPEKISYDSFNECLITYDAYKKVNGYNMAIEDLFEINTIELVEPISENTIGFYIDFEAIGITDANYNKDSVLYYYFDNMTNDTKSNFTFNQKLIHKKNIEFGISYYECFFEMNLDFEKIKEYYLRSHQDIGYAQIPIYFILSNGKISSLPTHNYFSSRKSRYFDLYWKSGIIGYGTSSIEPFEMSVCNIESKFIDPSSNNLYQNVLFKFKINIDI